ncbi:MAG TPA: hypothetical protein VFI61_02895 [Patescibacteria group bacterium]|nr:hypothetical protein [Patescibacteria group bacterium]
MSDRLYREIQEGVSADPIIFICYMGLERSRAITEVYQAAGIDATYFEGGTKRLSSLDIKEIRKEIGNYRPVIIYDQGSPSEKEYACKMRACELLDKANISYDVKETTTIIAMAFAAGGNLSDHLF